MSTSDRLLLILHIGFAIFTLGPLTAATMAAPRYIRKRDVTVSRYLHRSTRIYALGTLGILLFGLLLGQDRFDEVWLSASMTLFIVALVLLLLIERDQRKAVHLLEDAAAAEPPAEAAPEEEKKDKKKGDEEKAEAPAADRDIAQVERGRIAALSGVVALIWIVVLVLMVWNS